MTSSLDKMKNSEMPLEACNSGNSENSNGEPVPAQVLLPNSPPWQALLSNIHVRHLSRAEANVQFSQLLKMMKFKEEGKSSTPSLSESNDNSNTESCRSVNGLQLPPQTQPPSLSLAAFSHTSSPAAAILEPELYSEQSEILLGYSRHLLEQYGHSLDPVTMMYVILKLSKNIEVALVSLNQGYLEIQATKKYMAMRNPNWDLYNQGFPRPLSHPLSPTNLGQPTYFPEVPYMGLASSPRTSGLGLLQYPLGTHVFMSKVSSSPDSPPERSSSYPETAHTDESRPRSESVRKSFERCKSGLL